MRIIIAFLAIVSLLAPAKATAKCGTGNPISYDDITSALLTIYSQYALDSIAKLPKTGDGSAAFGGRTAI